MSRFSESWRSLGFRNFRLFFTGQLVSLVGTWMQSVALSWLVYRLTGQAVLLGLVAFTSQVPIFLLGSFGGVLADRVDPRRLLVITQSLQLLQALLLGWLTLAGAVRPWQIIVLAVALGVVNAFDLPARQVLEHMRELTEGGLLDRPIYDFLAANLDDAYHHARPNAHEP